MSQRLRAGVRVRVTAAVNTYASPVLAQFHSDPAGHRLAGDTGRIHSRQSVNDGYVIEFDNEGGFSSPLPAHYLEYVDSGDSSRRAKLVWVRVAAMLSVLAVIVGLIAATYDGGAGDEASPATSGHALGDTDAEGSQVPIVGSDEEAAYLRALRSAIPRFASEDDWTLTTAAVGVCDGVEGTDGDVATWLATTAGPMVELEAYELGVLTAHAVTFYCPEYEASLQRATSG